MESPAPGFVTPSAWTAGDSIALAGVIAAALVGLASLAFSWWVMRHGRAASFRAAFYERQLVAISEFVALQRELHDSLLTDPYAPPNDWAARNHGYTQRAVYLTPGVMVASSHWLSEVLNALSAYDADVDAGKSPQPEFERRMDAAWDRFLAQVRRELGLPTLYEEVHELSGAARLKREGLNRRYNRHVAEIRQEIANARRRARVRRLQHPDR